MLTHFPKSIAEEKSQIANYKADIAAVKTYPLPAEGFVGMTLNVFSYTDKKLAANYLNNVGKGKKIVSPIVFQGGVSMNKGVAVLAERVHNLGDSLVFVHASNRSGAAKARSLSLNPRFTFPFSFFISSLRLDTPVFISY